MGFGVLSLSEGTLVLVLDIHDPWRKVHSRALTALVEQSPEDTNDGAYPFKPCDLQVRDLVFARCEGTEPRDSV